VAPSLVLYIGVVLFLALCIVEMIVLAQVRVSVCALKHSHSALKHSHTRKESQMSNINKRIRLGIEKKKASSAGFGSKALQEEKPENSLF
jgi:hypothetical protein